MQLTAAAVTPPVEHVARRPAGAAGAAAADAGVGKAEGALVNRGGSNVWPNDVFQEPLELDRESPHQLICFVLSPFEPSSIYDPVLLAVQSACSSCATAAGVEIICRRADTLYEAKAVHDDIWRHLAGADVLVVDVTGLNSNVMIEFGVAAAWRRPQQVILIKSVEDDSKIPFNAFAQRYLRYNRSILGDQAFLRSLTLSMIQAITPAPYRPTVREETPRGGFAVDFRNGDRPDFVLSPSITYRRVIEDCLEFGSFNVFRNSWLLLGENQYMNVRARIVFRFAELRKNPDTAFLGISLRNQHFLANWGHMVFLQADGLVQRTEPEDDLGRYHDVPVDRISGFKHSSNDFVEVIAEFNNDCFGFSVTGLALQKSVSSMPYRYGAGQVRISVYQCRVRIKEIEVRPL